MHSHAFMGVIAFAIGIFPNRTRIPVITHTNHFKRGLEIGHIHDESQE